MPRSTVTRLAALAVCRFGVDRARIRELHTLVGRHSVSSFLHALLAQGILTVHQAEELRRASGAPRYLGRYRILRRLGGGGTGDVYLAYHPGEERHVALKVLADHLAASPVAVERFYRESKSSALLSHPHIVRGISVGQDPASGRHYLVREFVDGCSGLTLLEHLGRLPAPVAVHIALDAARALQHLHERDCVHRDIKPDNILLTRAGSAKIADLGLLKRRHDPLPRRSIVQGVGTSVYMPPEQAANASLVDGRSDLYALGATLYQFLTGEVPFPGDDHQAIIRRKEAGDFIPASRISPDLPGILDELLARLLAPRPADRPGSAASLIDELESSRLAAPPASWPAVADILSGARWLESAGALTRPDAEPLAATPSEGGCPRP